MIIHVKQTFKVVSKSGEVFIARNGDIIVPPEWVLQDKFFKALCDDGKITMHVDSKSIDLEQAKEENKKQELKGKK